MTTHKKNKLLSLPLKRVTVPDTISVTNPDVKTKPQVRRTSILDDYFKRGFFANPEENKSTNAGRYKTANALQNLHFRATRVTKMSASYSAVAKLDKHCGSRDDEREMVKAIASKEHKYLQHLLSALPNSLRHPVETLVFEGKAPGKSGIDRVRVGLDLIEQQMMTKRQQA